MYMGLCSSMGSNGSLKTSRIVTDHVLTTLKGQAYGQSESRWYDFKKGCVDDTEADTMTKSAEPKNPKFEKNAFF